MQHPLNKKNPSTDPVDPEPWSEGYVAVEYEALDRLEGVSHAARSLWLAARVRSSRLGEDGMIPTTKLRAIAASVGMSMRGARTAAAELVQAGVWRPVDAEFWQDTGYLWANKSREYRNTQKIKWRKQKDNQRANHAAAYSNDANVHGGQGGGQGGGHRHSKEEKRREEKGYVPLAVAKAPYREDAATQPPEGYELVDGAWLSPDGRLAWAP
jgi:hypothetical protein